MNEKQLGVIGDPIEHSLSPALFEFVLRELRLPFRYQAFRVPSHKLDAFVRKARAENFLGLNVTIPHKERVISLLDRLAPEAQQLRAVNTIVNADRKLIGHNTDILGFSQPLKDQGLELGGARAVVLGAGGAAKAVTHALIQLGIREITLANRTQERAKQLASQCAAQTNFHAICALALNAPQLHAAIARAALLVNATPVGMYPESEVFPLSDPSCLHSDLTVYDLVYNPLRTQLLKEAEKRGARIIPGLDMLIYQGLEALQLWTRGSATFSKELIHAARAHLQERLATRRDFNS